MSDRKAIPKFKGQKDFKSTTAFLSQFGDSVLMEDYTEIDPIEWIHSGNYLYNAHISGSLLKGFASNKLSTVAGDPKTGKSFLVYNAMRELQRLGYIIYFWETENALDRQRLVEQGIDLSKIMFEQPEIVDDVIIPAVRITDQLLKEKKAGNKIPKIAFIIDSTTALNTKKQYEDALKGDAKQDMGTLAKDLKRLFNMLAVRCGKLQIPIICTTHVYEKEMGNFRKRIPTGGNAAIFLSTVISMLRKTDNRDEDKQRIGLIVTAEIVETRYSNPIEVQFYLSFKKGMNPYFGLQEYVSWENCGICKGKMVDLVDLADEMIAKKQLQKASFDTKKFTKAEFKKHLSKAKFETLDAQLIYHLENKLITSDGNNYNFTEINKKSHYNSKGEYKPIHPNKKIHFPNPSSTNWIARHLDESFPTEVLFRDNVFTREVLEQLDKNVIIPLFEFKKEDISGSAVKEAEDDAVKSMDKFFDQDKTT